MNHIQGTQRFLPADEYDLICQVTDLISSHWRRHPSVEEMADHLHLSISQVQDLFRRWAGISPEVFLEVVTMDRVQDLVGSSAIADKNSEPEVLASGRLQAPFVTHEIIRSDSLKKGNTFAIRYGFHASPFGIALIMTVASGLVGIAFADAGNEAAALSDMARRWPGAVLGEDRAATAPYIARIFNPAEWMRQQPLHIVMIGTDFEIEVWRTLLKIQMGQTTTYSDIARHINKPKAQRAVGAAVGKNPISFIVPCHRVIGRSGAMTGYHWGIIRKQVMLGWEGARIFMQGTSS